ncbi:phosphoglycerate mutase-like protein [Coleophoma cylindrospora]|uniref:Phosphoglycerate mutase-like protein n=1 Tax=Coleophoma cylindrospora TaxID=1849047 RepID=A0A3D8RN28_9HELO|nr:phosphoglycerate mutase-like protein [Coleophoma cylindrospora]
MGKITIHCVRHAQGYHNLCEANHRLPDPDLTELGVQQCTTLSEQFPYHSKITDLVASPLRRTLYTCILSFPDEVARGLVITALPELQETSDLPCDTGSAREVLEKEFGSKVDFQRVQDGWNNKQGRWSPAAAAIEARARDARLFLRDLGSSGDEDRDREIVVVTHGGYLHYFTEDWEGNDKFTGTGWANTEWRSYQFVDQEGKDANASLKETPESRIRRVGHEHPLSEAEQRNLRSSAEEGWKESGFQKPADADQEAKL